MLHAKDASHAPGLLARALEWMKVHTDPAELAGFSGKQLRHMADDLQVTESDLLKLASHSPDNTALMEGMMRARGLDPVQVHNTFLTTLRDIERVCTLCRQSRRCQRELKAGTASANCHEYCPNAGTFDALLEDQIGR